MTWNFQCMPMFEAFKKTVEQTLLNFHNYPQVSVCWCSQHQDKRNKVVFARNGSRNWKHGLWLGNWQSIYEWFDHDMDLSFVVGFQILQLCLQDLPRSSIRGHSSRKGKVSFRTATLVNLQLLTKFDFGKNWTSARQQNPFSGFILVVWE